MSNVSTSIFQWLAAKAFNGIGCTIMKMAGGWRQCGVASFQWLAWRLFNLILKSSWRHLSMAYVNVNIFVAAAEIIMTSYFRWLSAGVMFNMKFNNQLSG